MHAQLCTYVFSVMCQWPVSMLVQCARLYVIVKNNLLMHDHLISSTTYFVYEKSCLHRHAQFTKELCHFHFKSSFLEWSYWMTFSYKFQRNILIEFGWKHRVVAIVNSGGTISYCLEECFMCVCMYVFSQYLLQWVG